MPDGQLVSHSVRVYVEAVVPITADPKLRLFGSNATTAPGPGDGGTWQPAFVATGQTWTEPSPNVQVPMVERRGTLLLFDLKSLAFDAKAMRRLMPVLEWQEGAATRQAVGRGEVNLGNTINVVAWTLTVVGAAVAIVLLLSWTRGGNPALLLTGVDGHLSLAQAQIACWTIAIGSVVLGYGFVRLAIPEIPEALLALMGGSLLTGGLGFFRDAQNQETATATTGIAPAKRSWGLADLVRTFPPNAPPELSLAKAQMLFWTVLLVVLFVSKSVLDGNIWSVPWPLVALMGFSQASFLAPKLAPPTPPPAGGPPPPK